MPKQNEKRSTAQKIWAYRKEILIGIILVLMVIFLVKNSDDVEFHMIFWTAKVPLILLLLLFGVVGAGIVGIYWLLAHREDKRTIRDLNKRIRELEHDVMVAKKKSFRSEPESKSTPEEDSDVE